MLPDRDSQEYPWHHRPDDHSIVGLFVDGPRGELSVLALLIAYTYCTVSASTPEGERRRRVVIKGRRALVLREDADEPPTPRQVWNGGRFSRPAKPATSGRKRKVA